MGKLGVPVACAMFAIAVGSGTGAVAQQAALPVAQSVAQPIMPTVPPLFAPKGLPAGGFRLFPILQLGADYDDNVYRTQAATYGDYYFLESPGFVLQSQWDRHELDLFGVVRTYQYASLTHENHTDVSAGGNGRLDILRGVDFKAGGSFNIHHEQRTSPDQPGGSAKADPG